jgi:hypothetical protein
VHNPAHLGSTDAGRSYYTEFSEKRAHWQSADTHHNDFLWAKILLLHAENLFIDFGAES